MCASEAIRRWVYRLKSCRSTDYRILFRRKNVNACVGIKANIKASDLFRDLQPSVVDIFLLCLVFLQVISFSVI